MVENSGKRNILIKDSHSDQKFSNNAAKINKIF